MSEETKNDITEPEVLVEKPSECNNDPEAKMIPLYTKLLARMSLVGIGVMIFIMALYKATQISDFNTTKLLLLEVCLLILLVFVIGISVALAMMQHDYKAKCVVSVLIYVSALSVMISVLLMCAFFKASPI